MEKASEYGTWSAETTRHYVEQYPPGFGSTKEHGDDLRCSYCPRCDTEHEDNLSFSIDMPTGRYYCHRCHNGGHIRSLIKNGLGKKPARIAPQVISSSQGSSQNTEAYSIYNKLLEAKPGGATDQYLFSRGIKFETWADFKWKLKEGPVNGSFTVAVYPFIGEIGEVVAIQKTFCDLKTKQKLGNKYTDKKSTGMGILQPADKIIVSEGLENGLSVRQHLGKDYGLLVCGDAGNMASLAVKNNWALKGVEQIIIAADNDIGNAGVVAARTLFCAFHKKALIFLPASPGSDWNNVLMAGNMEKEWI